MKFVLFAGVALIVIVILLIAMLYLRGRSLPLEHQYEQTVMLPAPLVQVKARVEAIEQHTSWRKDVKSITILGQEANQTRYIEESSHGKIQFKFVRGAQSPTSAVFESHIDDAKQPFSGYWRIELTAQDDATQVMIRETGQVPSPLFRAIAHDVFGFDRSVKTYLAALQASFIK